MAGTSGSSAEASGSSLDADTNAVAVASTFRHRMLADLVVHRRAFTIRETFAPFDTPLPGPD